MDADDLRGLLLEVDLPRQRVRRGGEGEYIPAWRVVAVAKRVLGLGDDAERQVDAAVVAAGGTRIAVVDPWRVLPDAVRRLRGRPLPPKDDLYAIPSGLLDGRG